MNSFVVPELGTVEVIERKGTRRLILRVIGAGKIRITAPKRTPKRVIEAFIREKSDWIEQQMEQKRLIETGDLIAHKYEVSFAPGNVLRPKSSVVGNNITIIHPIHEAATDEAIQQQAEKAIKKLLRKEAEDYLIDRLRHLAVEHHLEFKSVGIKQLRSRWGSCTNDKSISLNAQLMNLPHQLIDHVLLHELSHTVYMNHSQNFWNLLEQLDPHCKNHRKQLKSFDATSLVMA